MSPKSHNKPGADGEGRSGASREDEVGRRATSAHHQGDPMLRSTVYKSAMVIALGASLCVNPAYALEGFSTCHAAGTTVTSISGFDTTSAQMTSVMTTRDALEACHRNQRLNGAALKACVDKLMRDGDSVIGAVTVRANCKSGTLTGGIFACSIIHVLQRSRKQTRR